MTEAEQERAAQIARLIDSAVPREVPPALLQRAYRDGLPWVMPVAGPMAIIAGLGFSADRWLTADPAGAEWWIETGA